MKPLIYLTMVIGVINSTTAHTQAPGRQASGQEVAISGVYVGDRTIVQPEVYPFTSAGALTQRYWRNRRE